MTSRLHTLAPLLAAVALLAPAAGAQAAVRAPGETSSLGNEKLSDEQSVTRWAHVNDRAVVRSEPRTSAPRIARLRFETEQELPEVYVVLSSRRVNRHTWLKVRLPMRPNGRTGWVPREALGPLNVVRTFLRVDRESLRATLYERGHAIWSSRIGIGTPSTPTPGGRFYIRQRIRNLQGGTVYGPWAFGTSAYSTLSDWPGGGVVGVHGTDREDLIPGRPSHGCVRVPNAAITKLAKLMPIGTPVLIR